MCQLKILVALLTLSLSACTTPPAQQASPALSDELRMPCQPLPALVVPVDQAQDMRAALLTNRAAAQLVHAQCMARHAGILKAVGVTK